LKKLSSHIELGKEGEKNAKQFLENNGYTVLETNWRFRHKEIDIVCKYENLLVFVEVKTRTNDFFQKPYDAVEIKKQKLLIDAAEAFVLEYDNFSEIRFDIISIVYNNNQVQSIEHIKEAFLPQIND
jgi:putative endonuclease